MKCVCGAKAIFKAEAFGDQLRQTFLGLFPGSRGACRDCFQMVLAHAPSSGDFDEPSADADPLGPSDAHYAGEDLGAEVVEEAEVEGTQLAQAQDGGSGPSEKSHQGQFFATQKLASQAARTQDGCFKSTPGNATKFTCIVNECSNVRRIHFDKTAGRWSIKEGSKCEHGEGMGYLEKDGRKSVHLPTELKEEFQTLLQGNSAAGALSFLRANHPDSTIVDRLTPAWASNFATRHKDVPSASVQQLDTWVASMRRSATAREDQPFVLGHDREEDGSNF